MKFFHTFFLVVLIILSGCRSHKAVTASEMTVTHDSISADIALKSEISADDFKIFDFSAENLEILLKADSIKVGDSVIYHPEISTAVKKPKVSEQSSKQTVEKEDVKADIKAGSNTSSQKSSKEVRDVKRSYSWGLPTAIISLVVLLLLFYWHRRRHN